MVFVPSLFFKSGGLEGGIGISIFRVCTRGSVDKTIHMYWYAGCSEIPSYIVWYLGMPS